MKRSVVWLIALSFVSTLWCSNAAAVGLGFYLDGGSGSGEAEWESDTVAWDIDTKTAAVGFVLDTAPTNEKNFNYRLNVGLGSQNWEDTDGIELKSGGIYVENIFGFALKKSETFRWWLGPLVRLGYYSGETDTFYVAGDPAKVEVDYAEFGIGAVTGMNFKINKVILAPSLGVRFSGFAGSGTSTITTGGVTYSVDEDIEGNTTTGFLNLALMF